MEELPKEFRTWKEMESECNDFFNKQFVDEDLCTGMRCNHKDILEYDAYFDKRRNENGSAYCIAVRQQYDIYGLLFDVLVNDDIVYQSKKLEDCFKIIGSGCLLLPRKQD